MFSAVPINGETWLICGGRHFNDWGMFRSAMSDIIQIKGCPDKVVHGNAGGADAMATEWALQLAIEVVREPAEWKKFGKAAGPIRNQQMLDKHKPHIVVAFPGGHGTADMVTRARAANIDVIEIRPRTTGRE